MPNHPPRRMCQNDLRATDYISGDTFTLRRTDDGWWVTTPTPADWDRYYPRSYYGDGDRRFPLVVEWMQRGLYGWRAGVVTRAVGRAGRVLDVGCGPGHLLARFKARGWDAIGTEATEKAAAIPRARYQLHVRSGELANLKLADGEFDAVVSWHTLEHMRDPAAVLDTIGRVLKPGGVLFLSVPDFSSVEAQKDPSKWFHLDVPRHLCHFPQNVLRMQLERRGFVIEREFHSAPEYDAFSLLQTWLNRWGLPHNLLYSMLKSASSAANSSATAAQRGLAAITGALLLPLAIFVASWRAFRKTGAVVTLLARKTPAVELRGTQPGLN